MSRLNKKLLSTPIVAIGASAGGLDPYERFFHSTSSETGVAYVIIQHLSPNFQSMMDELLARHSKMDIQRVTDGMTVEKNTIYLNPPRTEMTVENGRFKLTEFTDHKQLNLPIDTFFTSLSIEAGDKALAVVLSGTGSDGTKGAQAIKAAGGMVFAQDLISAKFDGMPGSIIKLGIADAVGNPEILAENVGRILEGLPLVSDPDINGDTSPSQRIFQRLRERFGTEFNYYKAATIDRRLDRRASLRNLSLEDYANLIVDDTEETEALYGDLLIEVTSFFRDPDSFEQLRLKVIPQIAKNMTKTRPVRIWVPGCASGEEAYSIAIMCADYAREHRLELQLKILATDIHHRSLEKATAGIFDKDSMSGLSQEQIDRYFDMNEDKFQIKPHLRRMVVFSAHNILKDPPFTRMDLIACRNVLIYFNDVAQQKTLALFHFGLRKSGYLFLGPSETTGKLESEFSVLDAKWRIFQKKRDVRLLDSVSMLPSPGAERDGFDAQNIRTTNTVSRTAPIIGSSRQAHNDTLKELLRRYAPPGILLNDSGEIAHVFGNASEFLKIESGVFSNKIVDLVDDELKMIIATGLERVKSSTRRKFERRISSSDRKLGEHSVIIMIEKMTDENASEAFNLLTIERVKPSAAIVDTVANIQPLDATEATAIMQARISDLERDLLATEESLQSTIEELETSNEELQATNEELMASNEELQSTNEELHSVNEELYTVSTEHQHKIEELMQVTDDMDNLLRATDIGIVFLDNKLQIRRFTPSAKETFNVITQDIGRPFEHITYRFDDFGLNTRIAEAHATGNVFECEVEADKKTFVLRILPYRSSNEEIFGLVITTIDITEVKLAEIDRAETTQKFEAIVSDLTDFLLRWSPETNEVTFANHKLADILERPIDKIVGSQLTSLAGYGGKNSIFANLNDISVDTEFKDEILRFDASGKEIYVSGTVRPILDKHGKIIRLQATGRDVTAQYNYRIALEKILQLRETLVVGNKMGLINDLLLVGSEYLGMPHAALHELRGNDYYMLSSSDQKNLQVGERIPMPRKIVERGQDTHEIFAIHDIVHALPDQKTALQQMDAGSYASICVGTVGGDYGRIAFADRDARLNPFSDLEKMFLRLLRNSVEALLERNNFLTDIDYRRQHFSSIYDKAPIMMSIVNAKGKILEANAVWYKKLGFTEERTIGSSFMSFVSDRAFKKEWSTFPRYTNEGNDIREATTKLRTRKNGELICELSSTLLPSPEGTVERHLISIVDVTDQIHSFERIEDQKRELERANEGLSTFAYVASHDLQEPLRKIQQYVEMLQLDCEEELDKEGQYYLDVISGSAARISYLVKDILSYTTASNVDIDIVHIDLNEILSDVVEDTAEQLDQLDASVSVKNLPRVAGDLGATRVLFQNILSNGLKYQDSDAKPKISIKARELKTKHIIDFADNGIGIEVIDGKDIFEPFVRLHSKFDYAGTGIGLAICKTICKRMGWSIAHKPNTPGGTVFSISIPKR